MNPVALVLIASFIALLLLNTPIAVAIGLSSLLAVLAAGYDPIPVIATRLVSGIDSFALLAIPFFILAGLLMGRGGIARRLIDFAMALLGWLPGGLAYVNTLTCMLFGSISGSAAAAVSSVGGFMVPEMEKRGFATPFSVAVTTTAATTGLLIPPSNIMIVYAVTAGGVSIAAMFLAGVLPGILVGLGIMAVCWWFNRRRGMQAEGRLSGAQVWLAFRRAIMSLLLIVIVIGGILGGVFTPTDGYL